MTHIGSPEPLLIGPRPSSAHSALVWGERFVFPLSSSRPCRARGHSRAVSAQRLTNGIMPHRPWSSAHKGLGRAQHLPFSPTRTSTYYLFSPPAGENQREGEVANTKQPNPGKSQSFAKATHVDDAALSETGPPHPNLLPPGEKGFSSSRPSKARRDPRPSRLNAPLIAAPTRSTPPPGTSSACCGWYARKCPAARPPASGCCRSAPTPAKWRAAQSPPASSRHRR